MNWYTEPVMNKDKYFLSLGYGIGQAYWYSDLSRTSIYDKGGIHWIKSTAHPERGLEAREIGLYLRSVTWHVLNEANDYFNRNSLVLSVLERLPELRVIARKEERVQVRVRWPPPNSAPSPPTSFHSNGRHYHLPRIMYRCLHTLHYFHHL